MRWLIRSFFKVVRAILGPMLLVWEKLTAPKGIERSAEEQQRLDAETRHLALYQFKTCPFCIKVRRTVRRLSLNIETRDAQHSPEHREQLRQGGGALKVPCLKISDGNGDTWLYESHDIIRYLQQQYG